MLHPTEKDIHAALDYGRFLSGQNCTPEQRMISDLTKEVSRLTLAVFDREAALINKVSELERENARLVNQIDNLRKCGTAVRNALSYSERSWPNDQTKIREWDMLVGLRPDFPSV